MFIIITQPIDPGSYSTVANNVRWLLGVVVVLEVLCKSLRRVFVISSQYGTCMGGGAFVLLLSYIMSGLCLWFLLFTVKYSVLPALQM